MNEKILTQLRSVVPVEKWAEFQRLKPRKRQPVAMAVLEDDLRRFSEQISINAVTNCWNWIGRRDEHGYGKFRIMNAELRSHRVSLYFHGVIIPSGMGALHKCDNPKCVNPEHLFIGTQKDNLSDMAAKRRSTHGERNPARKLTAQQVLQIRRLAQQGVYQKSIADEFGVRQTAISKIVNRETWTQI